MSDPTHVTTSIDIGGRPVGPGHPCYLIAELSANHNGSFEEALDLVRLAKESGADAVKLQTYTPDTLTIEATGNPDKLDALLRDLEPYGIKEMVQSGLVAIGRGSRSITTGPALRAA